MEDLGKQLSTLLMVAWLLPFFGFCIEVFGGYFKWRLTKTAAYIAVGCIGVGFLCSVVAFMQWGNATDWVVFESHEGEHHVSADHDEAAKSHDEHGAKHDEHAKEHEHGEEHADEHGEKAEGAHDSHGGHAKPAVQTAFSGQIYHLARFGELDISIDYYIDSLTLGMFMMVTLIATCIHVFAIGYMSDELTESYEDHFVHTSDGGHFKRPGRFYRFFSYMSLFCFSMLGLVLAGNIFQVFVFWELVGICSFLLIGFYVERKSASTAANKAFIVNRVGDFGFIIGLMILWTSCGTFRFDNYEDHHGHEQPGLFQMVRGNDGHVTQDGDAVVLKDVHGEPLTDASGSTKTIPYMLLVAAGLGVFCGCVGKSAQFPLQTWLPDAMEGPTPVSALVHSATMVAAGVYLAGRFFPMFLPEVLLTIAYVGCVTLFVAATIAVVATDIKRVLAYSTISQLGYMMLGIGVGGWGAGLFHLITHAFFKSLMFLCSGSVIHGCHHEQEMPKMGGLWKKMPVTAFTMLVGVIAIAGLAIPGTSIAFSGYHSKDAIVATALQFVDDNPVHILLFIVPLVTAGITAFYMFRLWFYTFAGQPRDAHVYEGCHESPSVMCGPLLVLAPFAAWCAIGGEHGKLFSILALSEPASTEVVHASHDIHTAAGSFALVAAILGTLTAYLLYGKTIVDPANIKRQFSGLHTFLVEKWRFDELYDVMFVRPSHVVGKWCAGVDKYIFDEFLHGVVRTGIRVSQWDRKFDEGIIDGLVNLVGNVTFSIGRSLHVFQTGNIRQYVMFIAVGVLMLFALLFAFSFAILA
ncbi:MAG: NADH-quinone oxidoreductase subunit L [Planctomycetaceae bacterium]|nr:NADH-quinone oxidoreductase subunit L [Planctomycetaceae bacterium]